MSPRTPSTTRPAAQETDLDALRARGGGDIPVTAAPPQKKTDPTVHYTLCAALTVAGAAVIVIGVLGVLGATGVTGHSGFPGSALLAEIHPWFLLISLFFLLPGVVGLYRGPGETSTHVIPRPKNRRPVDPTAGAGGAAGPAPTA